MPLRWADPRLVFDPEEGVGMPRPFHLGDTKSDTPFMRHALAQPKKAKPYPKDERLPAYQPLEFWALPHQDKRYKYQKPRNRRVYLYLQSQLQQYKHWLVKRFGFNFYISILKGGDDSGVYIVEYDTKGREVWVQRAPSYAQYGKAPRSEKALRRLLMFYWTNDRPKYWDYVKQVQAQRDKQQDANRRRYDDWAANVKNQRNKARYDYYRQVREYDLQKPDRW
jgi:hypothetical protein